MTYRINGIPVTREQFVNYKPGQLLQPAATPQLRKAGAWTSPKHCEALAVDPEDIPFERQIDQEQGLGDVEYNPKTGSPVFYSPGKYDEYVRAKGYVNKSSCGKHHHLSPELLRRIVERHSSID